MVVNGLYAFMDQKENRSIFRQRVDILDEIKKWKSFVSIFFSMQLDKFW